jgi:hypothetical protein
MQLDKGTLEKYKIDAPELLDAVDTGEAEHIMKRDPDTDYCIKFDAGWCGVHKSKGTDFLGDACHFYPRITRQLGDETYMTATFSCPEVARLTLFNENALLLKEEEVDRVPYSIKDYAPEGINGEDALVIHMAFIDAASEEESSAERILARINSVANSLEHVSQDTWKMAVPFYLKNANDRLPTPQSNAADPFNLLHALTGLVAASKPTSRPRLETTISTMESALDCTIDTENITLKTGDKSLSAYLKLSKAWQDEHAAHFAPILKRWIQVEMAANCFPYAGLGNTPAKRMTILSVRFATVKLALMCECALNGQADEATTVRIIQSLERFLGHLADPTLSLQIYQETGWTEEPRLRALIGDA